MYHYGTFTSVDKRKEFTEEEIKVAFHQLEYDGDTGAYSFELWEDVI